MPDISGVFHGPDAVRRLSGDSGSSAWETVQFEYELVERRGGVVALMDQRMRGRSTGVEVPFGKSWRQVYTFKDGSTTQLEAVGQSKALEAVGLRSRQTFAQARGRSGPSVSSCSILDRPLGLRSQAIRDTVRAYVMEEHRGGSPSRSMRSTPTTSTVS